MCGQAPVLWPVLWSVVWLAASCSVDVKFGEQEWRCAEEPECPSGHECVASRCVLEGSTVDAAALPPIDATSFLAPVIPDFALGVLVAELTGDSMAGDDDITYSADRLVAIFNNTSDIWTASRAVASDAWSEPTVDASLSSAENDQTPAISANGLTLLFGSDRPGGLGMVDLYVTRRNQRSEVWATPVLLTGVNGPTNELASWISNDGRSILFHSDSSGDYDIYEATGDSATGVFGNVRALSAINVVGSTDASARYVQGGLVLTFHSNRQGTDDLYAATRASTDDPFGEAAEIVGVNSDDVEQDIWMAEDLCLIAYVTRAADDLLRIHEATCL